MASATSLAPFSDFEQTKAYKALYGDGPTGIDDDFKWLAPMHPVIQRDFAQHLRHAESQAVSLGKLETAIAKATDGKIELPMAFRFFFRNGLSSRVPSVTANYFGLYPDDLILCPPAFGGGGGVLVRFWTDQQDCYTWYLYVDQHRRHCVVGTAELLETETGTSAEANVLVGESGDFEIWAPSFTDFIFFAWASNTVLYKGYLHVRLTKQEEEYRDKYAVWWDDGQNIDEDYAAAYEQMYGNRGAETSSSGAERQQK